MHNLFKFLVVASLIISPISSAFSQSLEPQDIIDRLHSNEMTIYTSIDEYRPTQLITRWETAKMISKFAESLELTKDYPWSCDFEDISNYDDTLVPFITTSCEFGLLKWWNGMFTPTGTLTQAQALVIIQRARSGFRNETWTPWYREYFQEALQLWIVSSDQILSVESTPITRFELGARLYRASWNWTNTIDTTVYIPQWAVETPPIVVVWDSSEKSSNTTANTSKITVLNPTASRTSRDETSLGWSYTWNFNYDTYQPYSDAKLQLELAAGRRVVLVFGSQSSLQSRTLDTNIRQWVWWNISILFVDFDIATSLRTIYWVSKTHTVVYLDSDGKILFSTTGKDVSVKQIINNFDNGNGGNSNSRI